LETGQVVSSELFLLTTCTVLRASSHGWSSANSTVYSTPIIDVMHVFSLGRIEIGASIVRIEGECGEPLHFHISHLVGLVVRGCGWLCIPDEAETARVARVRVDTGDAVVIPRGALHLFECEPDGFLDYIALEISDRPIDYQKHWKPENPSDAR